MSGLIRIIPRTINVALWTSVAGGRTAGTTAAGTFGLAVISRRFKLGEGR
jgi:hypothetical protein